MWIGKNEHWHVALPVVGNPDKFDPKVTTSYLPARSCPLSSTYRRSTPRPTVRSI